MNNKPHAIFITKVDDGSFVAASIDTPRFCVGGPTEREAFEKAQRALDFYRRFDGVPRNLAPKETRVISPVYEQRELCA